MEKITFAKRVKIAGTTIVALIIVLIAAIASDIPWIKKIIDRIYREKDEPDRISYYNDPESQFDDEDFFVQDIATERRNRLAKLRKDRRNFMFFINQAQPRRTVKTVKPLMSAIFVPRRTLRQKIC